MANEPDNVRIIEMDEQSTLSQGSYTVTDNQTNGTKKFDLYNLKQAIDAVADGTAIEAGAIGTTALADGAATTDKIGNGAITNPKLGSGAVALSNIASDSNATSSRNGLMSSMDKAKLDEFSSASNYALKSDLTSLYKYKGSVATEAGLPSSGQTVGDVYNIVAASSYGAAGMNVAWNGSAWDALGEKYSIADGTIIPSMVSSGYNLMSDAEQTKLTGIEAQANKTVVDSALSESSTNPLQNKVIKQELSKKASVDEVAALRDIIRGTEHIPNSWNEIAALADDAEGSGDFLAGTRITDTFIDKHVSPNVNYDCDFVLQHFQEVELQDTTKVNAAIIGMLQTLPFSTEFSPKQAFYACPSGGKAADTYYFTFGTTWGSKIISGTSYSFTTTMSHPEGAQFVFSGNPYSNDASTMKVNIYDTCGGTTLSEACQISAGIASGATQLCTLSSSIIGANDSHNHLQRCIYGDGRWRDSAVRQILNSDLVSGWWTPQTKWDRPPSYVNYPGFLTMLPPELVELIQPIKVVTSTSYSADGGSSSTVETDITYDKVWLPSWEQHYLKVSSSYGGSAGIEGEAFDYWKRVAGVSTPWEAGTTHPEYIHTQLGTSTARSVFLRSPHRGNGYSVAYIGASGGCGSHGALYGIFVVPVFAIRQSVSS